jgi:hypothetical protein
MFTKTRYINYKDCSTSDCQTLISILFYLLSLQIITTILSNKKQYTNCQQTESTRITLQTPTLPDSSSWVIQDARKDYMLNWVTFQVLTAASMKFRVFWDVALCSLDEVERCFRDMHGLVIALMMEEVCTSETSVHFNETTWHYIPEYSKLQNA